MRRTLAGCAVGIASSIALGGAMFPLRPHLAVATCALVLVLPVVAGVVVGGFVAGIASVAAGFVVYDIVFVPPYYTLTVSNAQNWTALAVYAVVMILVARVVSGLEEARSASVARATNSRRLFELSELLLAERPLEDLGQAIVTAVKQTFALSAVALLASIGDRLEVVAAEGTALSDSELTGLKSGTSEPVRLSTGAPNEKAHILALSTSGRPVGLLVMRGLLGDRELREMLPTLANHLALAVERAQLHERALRTEVLEEVDRLRGALVGGVSHDLRTPLSTIKIAATTLSDPAHDLSEEDARELYELIDVQADRLTRVVTSLLDMTRLEAGVLKLDRSACSVLDLVGEAVAALRPALSGMEVRLEIPPDLPEVDVDHMLIGQVLTNLLENAHRHAPPGTVITVRGSNHGSELVALTVSDRGPGVRPSERQSVFESFVKFDTGGRAGLGLALAKTFVEAHGGRIWVEDTPGGGASFVFTVSAANATAAHALP